MEGIYDLELLQEKKVTEKGLLLYFSTESCSVCKVLKPRVEELLLESFPKISSFYIDVDKSPLVSGQHQVFTIPTILLYFDSREHARFSRNISIHQLEDAIRKSYSMIFNK